MTEGPPKYLLSAGPVQASEVAMLSPLAPTNCQRFRQLAEHMIHGNTLERDEALSYESFIDGGATTAKFHGKQTAHEVVEIFRAQEPGYIIFANPIYKSPYQTSEFPQTKKELLRWLEGRHQAIYGGTKNDLTIHPLSGKLLDFLKDTKLDRELEKYAPDIPLIVHATVRSGRAAVWDIHRFLRHYAPVRIKSPVVRHKS